MPQEMIGPWRREDYDSFIALNVDLKPEIPTAIKLSDLLSMGIENKQTHIEHTAIERAWLERTNHPIYLWLKRNEHYKKIWRRFENMRAKAQSESLASDMAPFRMLKILVEYAGWYFGIEASRKRFPSATKSYGPTATRRAAAIKHIDALLELYRLGVSLEGIEGYQLRQMLIQFRAEMVKMGRKPRGGKGSVEREIMERMVSNMLLMIGVSSPVIVENFAAMVGLECDSKTAQRYCDSGKERYSELISRRKYGQNSTSI